MQEQEKLPEVQVPFKGIIYGDYNFVPTKKQEDKAFRICKLIEAHTDRMLARLGSCCLKNPAWMQPLADETRAVVLRNEALLKAIEDKYSLLPF